ncbi:MAG: mannose-1-phosphate guanylyltransferase, partial [Bacteroidales bacterium]|nr:mannose-1-phosphate guanylyltransferase [Bacteroidales bacterium]
MNKHMTKNPNNFCIIMAGGFGSRFWPLCSVEQPKQFLDLLGTGMTMTQDTFRRFETVCPRDNIIIVTTKAHERQVREQLGELKDYQILCEPFRRNTAPCIAYAASVIRNITPM